MGEGVTSLGSLIWGADDEPGCVSPEPEVRHYRQLAWRVDQLGSAHRVCGVDKFGNET